MALGDNETAYMSLLKEIQDTRRECADGHSETMAAVSKIRETQQVFGAHIESINTQLADIKGQVVPLVSACAVHDRAISDAEADVQRIYGMISDDRAKGRVSFWDGPNARLVLVMGTVLIVGLIGLAGYNISIKDFTP